MSVYVDGKLFQDSKRNNGKCFRMGALQNNFRSRVDQVGFEPPLGTQAPPVLGAQAGKTELRTRSAQVVSALLTEIQEFVGDNTAYGVAPVIVRTGVAASVPIESGERVERTRLQLLAEDIKALRFRLTDLQGGLPDAAVS